MVFTRFVEIGRVAFVNYGPLVGKYCVILNVVDQNRVLVDGPEVPRQVMSVKRLSLSQIVAKVAVEMPAAEFAAALKEQNIAAQFAATKDGRVIARRVRRAALTDFERFKVAKLRAQRSKIIREAFTKLKASKQ